MERMVQDHEKRIINLEEGQTQLQQSQAETNEAVKAIQKENDSNRHSMLKLENTVLQSNKEQKELLNKLIDYSLNTSTKEKEREYDLKKINLVNKWQVALTLVGSGSILILIIQLLFK